MAELRPINLRDQLPVIGSTDRLVLGEPGSVSLPLPRFRMYERTVADPALRALSQTTMEWPNYFRIQLTNARLLGQNILILGNEFFHDKLSMEQASWTWPAARNDLRANTAHTFSSARADRVIQRIDGTSIVVDSTTSANYHHWLIDCLPILATLSAATIEADHLVISDDISPRFIEMGKLYGLRPDKLKRFKADSGGVVEFEKLIFTSPLSVLNRWVRPELLAFLRAIIPVAKANVSGGQQPKRIYVSRFDSGNRVLLNEDELARELERRGFVILRLTERTFLEQVTLFNDADLIVGLHGAGLANLVFANHGAQFLLIEHEYKGYTFYNHLCSLLAVWYSVVIGDTFANPGHSQPYQNQNWIVDIRKVLRSVEAIGG